MANHLTEFQMNQYFGWTQGSDMASTYVHMSGRETDKAILAMNGVTPKEQAEEDQLKPIICQRCETINPKDHKYCSNCANILDMKYIFELEKQAEKEKLITGILYDLLLDPKVVRKFKERMKEKNAQET